MAGSGDLPQMRPRCAYPVLTRPNFGDQIASHTSAEKSLFLSVVNDAVLLERVSARSCLLCWDSTGITAVPWVCEAPLSRQNSRQSALLPRISLGT